MGPKLSLAATFVEGSVRLKSAKRPMFALFRMVAKATPTASKGRKRKLEGRWDILHIFTSFKKQIHL